MSEQPAKKRAKSFDELLLDELFAECLTLEHKPLPTPFKEHQTANDKLPDELLSDIFGHLIEKRLQVFDEIEHMFVPAPTKKTLLPSSRVSRRWRQVALRHLFRDIDFSVHIDADRQLRTYTKEIDASWSTRNKRKMAHLVDFYKAHAEIAGYVRTVLLRSGKTLDIKIFLGQDLGYTGRELVREMKADTLTGFLGLLPSLRTLVLADVGIAMPCKIRTSMENLYLCVSQRPAVDVLKALNVFEGIKNLVVVLPGQNTGMDVSTAFHRVKKHPLAIEAFSFRDGTRWGKTPSTDLVALNGIAGTVRPFTHAFLNCATKISLKKVSIDWVCSELRPASYGKDLRQFLRSFSENLEELELRVIVGSSWPDFFKQGTYTELFENTSWPALKRLLFKIDLAKTRREWNKDETWERIADILDLCAPCPELQSVAVTVLRRKEEVFSDSDSESSDVESSPLASAGKLEPSLPTEYDMEIGEPSLDGLHGISIKSFQEQLVRTKHASDPIVCETTIMTMD